MKSKLTGKTIVLVAVCLVLSSCGRPGSLAWNATASPEQKAMYAQQLHENARVECSVAGMPQERMNDCITYVLNKQEEVRQASRHEDMQKAIDGLRPPPTTQTNCLSSPGMVNCWSN